MKNVPEGTTIPALAAAFVGYTLSALFVCVCVCVRCECRTVTLSRCSSAPNNSCEYIHYYITSSSPSHCCRVYKIRYYILR